MSKFQLSGVQTDMVRSLAIHQDADGLVDFIQTLVDEQVAKGAPPIAPSQIAIDAEAFRVALAKFLADSNAS